MGIPIEFTPDLALRRVEEFKAGRRKKEECLPIELVKGAEFEFLKKDQKNFWMYGQVPLVETKGNGVLSSPLAGVRILEATHFLEDGIVWTKGKYKVLEVYGDKGKDLPYDYFQRNGFDEE